MSEEIDNLDWKNPDHFAELVEESLAPTVADRISDFDIELIAELLHSLKPDIRAEVFSNLNPSLQTELATVFKKSDIADLLEWMSPDERADYYGQLHEDIQDAVLPLMARAEREDLRKLVAFEEGTAGSLMTSDYATLVPNLTVVQAIDSLRRQAPDSETIYNAYVINSDRSIVGVVSLRDLMLATSHTKIADIMHPEVISADVNDKPDFVANLIAKYDLLAIPIIDTNRSLVGIVTVDDVMDYTKESVTEDFHKHASLGAIQTSLKDASVWLMFSKRIPWLLVLVFMNIFSGAGIAFFEDTIAAVVSLVFFLPLLIDSGGNAGSQASTPMVRALATDDVRTSDWLKFLKKELLVALSMGLAMAFAVSFIGYFRSGYEVAVIVSITMVLVVIVGSLIGMSLPFLLTKLKLDPATASAPLITSIADIAGVMIYFSIATWYLKNMAVVS